MPSVANADDCESVPAPPPGAHPSVPVSNENSRIAAVGSGSTVIVIVAWFEDRLIRSSTT